LGLPQIARALQVVELHHPADELRKRAFWHQHPALLGVHIIIARQVLILRIPGRDPVVRHRGRAKPDMRLVVGAVLTRPDVADADDLCVSLVIAVITCHGLFDRRVSAFGLRQRQL
jgi:hypothetical protein